MNFKQREFCRQYVIDGNATQAYIRAKYSPDGAAQSAEKLLRNTDIQNYIAELERMAASRAELTADWVLEKWRALADADPNELTTVRILCCRFCWGFEHRYQWREREFEEAMGRACASEKPVPFPDGRGGMGYDPRKDPNSDCPECLGEGIERISVKDTRKLSAGGRQLYGGVKVKKDGSIEVVTRNQDAALLNIAKFVGMVVDKKEHSGPGGGPIPTANLKSEDFTTEQLKAIIAGKE